LQINSKAHLQFFIYLFLIYFYKLLVPRGGGRGDSN